MKTAAEFRAAFEVVIEGRVKWGEMDAYDHVNNAVYFRYFEDVRMAQFEGLGILESMRAERKGPILAATDARFRAPLRYPDEILVGSRIGEVGEDRFVMHYGIWSGAQACLATEGSGRVVFFDYDALAKCAIPPALRSRLEASAPGR